MARAKRRHSSWGARRVAPHALIGLLGVFAGCGDPEDTDADTGEEHASRDDAGRDASVPDATTPSGPLADGSTAIDAAVIDAAADAGVDASDRDAASDSLTFQMRVVTEGLAAPWEVRYGPDDRLWITERTGKRVLRLDPATGMRKTAITIDEVHQSSGQDGLLGLALHPDLLRGRGRDHVFVAYTYDADPGAALARRAKIVRYTYDAASETLSRPETVIANLPASDDHNSGRLELGPDQQLYYAIGDQGANQFDNKCQPIRAQDLPTADQLARADYTAYQGKVLRLASDGAIPPDNPVIAGVRSHVFTYGHRNPQGIAFAADGSLYASEQGPKTDDELNLLRPGKNYGWPHVAGQRDDEAYVYGNWSGAPSCASLSFDDYALPASVPRTRETEWTHPDFTPPLATFYTVSDDYDFRMCQGAAAYVCWPTIAPSSLEVYEPGPGAIPRLGRALLMTSLKEGSVIAVLLTARDAVEQTSATLFDTTDRYRDLTIAPDRQTFYVVTDPSGDTSGPTRGATQALEHRGAVLAFRWLP